MWSRARKQTREIAQFILSLILIITLTFGFVPTTMAFANESTSDITEQTAESLASTASTLSNNTSAADNLPSATGNQTASSEKQSNNTSLVADEATIEETNKESEDDVNDLTSQSNNASDEIVLFAVTEAEEDTRWIEVPLHWNKTSETYTISFSTPSIDLGQLAISNITDNDDGTYSISFTGCKVNSLSDYANMRLGTRTVSYGNTTFHIMVSVPMQLQVWDETDSSNRARMTEYDENFELKSWTYTAPVVPGYVQSRADYADWRRASDGTIYLIQRVYYKVGDPDDGDFVLEIVDYDENQQIGYRFTGFLDENGKPLNGREYQNFSHWFFIDGQRVFCVDPQRGTWSGVRYFAREADENLYAAFASMYGDVADTLLDALTRAYVWELIGNKNGTDHPYYYNPTSEVVSDLSDEDYAKTRNFLKLIQDAVNAYQSKRTADFIPATEGVTLVDGKLHIASNVDPSHIVLNARNTDILDFYSRGNIVFPEGVTGKVEGNQLILSIDRNTYKGGNITLSMIKENWPTATIEYYSEKDRQTLMSFGITDQNGEGLGIVFDADTPLEESNEPTKPIQKENSILPQTGDKITSLYSLIFLAGIGLTGMAGSLIARRRSQKN